ncbi:MAG: hypothetical protein JXB48_09830 [Candidatus Latescibacteria bacterium]|nr:hypothetical protein [Candidatus Latescibacterota bacterium]
MQTLGLLFYLKAKMLKSLLLDTRKSYLLRNISTGIVLFALLYISYIFFYNLIFMYVSNLEEIGSLLIDRLVSLGFLAFFFMLIISSFVSALATLFRSTETEYLFSTPLSDLHLLLSKYFDIIIYSSWAILFMALPILYAYAKIRRFGTFEYALTGFFVLLPFILIATAIGTVFSILAVLISKYISIRRLIVFGSVVFASFIFLVIKFSQTNQLTIPFTEDFRALNIFINNFQLNAHPLTPNFWLIQCLRSLVLHEYKEFVLYASALMTSALFVLSFLFMVGEKMYFKTWMISNEQTVVSKKDPGFILTQKCGFFSRTPKTQAQALFNKDVLTLIREPGQWSQILLILALLILYLFNLRMIPQDITDERWITIISIMNYGFCGFILATFAIRFVFPSISLEGKSFWVLSSAPLSTSTLFRVKFMTAFVAFFIIGETIALISSAILKLEGLYQLMTISGIFLMSISLSTLAVGMGAAYPDFSENNPSKIATSPGGILTIVLSLLYIAVMLMLYAVTVYRYTLFLVSGNEFPRIVIISSILLTVVLNAVTIILPLRFGARTLAQKEF